MTTYRERKTGGIDDGPSAVLSLAEWQALNPAVGSRIDVDFLDSEYPWFEGCENGSWPIAIEATR